MSTRNPINCHIQYLYPRLAWNSLHNHPTTSIKPSVGSCNTALWVFAPASFEAHIHTLGYSSSSQVILFSNRLVSLGSDFSHHLCAGGFQISPCASSSLSHQSSLLLASAPLTFSLVRVSPLCLTFLYLCFCRLQLPSCCCSASEKLNARSPMTLTAGYWLNFKIWWWHCGSEATRNCGLNGCSQCEWTLALTSIWTHCRASLTIHFPQSQTPGGFLEVVHIKATRDSYYPPWGTRTTSWWHPAFCCFEIYRFNDL